MVVSVRSPASCTSARMVETVSAFRVTAFCVSITRRPAATVEPARWVMVSPAVRLVWPPAMVPMDRLRALVSETVLRFSAGPAWTSRAVTAESPASVMLPSAVRRRVASTSP